MEFVRSVGDGVLLFVWVSPRITDYRRNILPASNVVQRVYESC